VRRDGELAEVRITMSKRRVVKFCGVLMCGRIWTCPVCSEKKRAERAQEVMDALEGAGGRWQMVTFAPAHRAEDCLTQRHQMRVIRTAWVRTKRGGKVQRVMKARVSASVRAFEVTWGWNGLHPHVHVLWRTTQWTEEERQALAERFIREVTKLDPRMTPSVEHGVVWSHPIDASNADERKRARYVSKLGLEIVGVGKWKRSIWSLAARAASGHAPSARRWRDFEEAVRGARMIEADMRALNFAAQARAARAPERDDDVVPAEVVSITIDRTELALLGAAERRDPRFMGQLVGALTRSDDPRCTWEQFLCDARDLVRSRDGQAQDHLAGDRRAREHPPPGAHHPHQHAARGADEEEAWRATT
jgi:hypothetical protein